MLTAAGLAVVLGMGAPPFGSAGLHAAEGPLAVPQESASSQESAPSDVQARILGDVVEATTGNPVAGALVRLREINRSDLSHGDGSYHLDNLPAGTFTIVVQRIGYATLERSVDVPEDQVVRVDLALERSAISLPGIVVTGVGRPRGVDETYRPTAVLSGEELNRRLAATLARTIMHEPGIAARTFGPAPAQPVIRGMSGDRVLVLEDGQRTGDLSTTGPDHAVGVDPAGAQRIEIVRGPAGLLYGSNALGGVINVIREEIPRRLPDHAEGAVTLQGESVNRGAVAAGTLLMPLGFRYALRAEAGGRRAGDVRTPQGSLPATDSRGLNGAIAVSRVEPWGFLGVSYRDYLFDHGVPGEFRGDTIPGAHPGGADLETRRQVGRVQFGHFDGAGPFSSVEAEASLIRYVHDEIEGVLGTGQRVIGTSFDQITGTLNVAARHQHDEGVVTEGAIGAFAMGRDLITGGSFPGVRDGREWLLAAYAYEEFGFDPVRLQLGARIDHIRIDPRDRRPVPSDEGLVTPRERTFTDVSGSVAGLWDFRPGWTAGVSVARAFRAPALRELFSDGPHLADFSYDVGNPELEREVGLGTDVFLRVARPRVNFELTAFRNAIRNFIHHRPTGALDPRFGRFPLFVATGGDALFEGAEGGIQWEAHPGVVLDGTLSWVRAEYREGGEPLPGIPPLNGGLRARWEIGDAFVSAGWRGAAAQRRVPFAVANPVEGEPDLFPEDPTDGYHLLDAGVGFRWSRSDRNHSVTLAVDNTFNTAWRDHLSRARQVAPEPGRNLQLLYRVAF